MDEQTGYYGCLPLPTFLIADDVLAYDEDGNATTVEGGSDIVFGGMAGAFVLLLALVLIARLLALIGHLVTAADILVATRQPWPVFGAFLVLATLLIVIVYVMGLSLGLGFGLGNLFGPAAP